MRKITIVTIFIALAGMVFIAFNTPSLAVEGALKTQGNDLMDKKPDNYPVATLAGGCFWCLESEFRGHNGILYTNVGYTGGNLDNPTYKDVSTGRTGHAEAVEITFDPNKISYENLLIFFLTKAHNPTQLNGQGVDIGTQYRSEIFFHDDNQRKIAEKVIDEINAKKIYNAPIVTKISPAGKFWNGEEYHQQYYEKYEKETGQIHPRLYFEKQAKKLKQE